MGVKIRQKTERWDKSVEKQSWGLKVPTTRLNELNNGMDKKCAAGIVKVAHACTLLRTCSWTVLNTLWNLHKLALFWYSADYTAQFALFFNCAEYTGKFLLNTLLALFLICAEHIVKFALTRSLLELYWTPCKICTVKLHFGICTVKFGHARSLLELYWTYCTNGHRPLAHVKP